MLSKLLIPNGVMDINGGRVSSHNGFTCFPFHKSSFKVAVFNFALPVNIIFKFFINIYYYIIIICIIIILLHLYTCIIDTNNWHIFACARIGEEIFINGGYPLKEGSAFTNRGGGSKMLFPLWLSNKRFFFYKGSYLELMFLYPRIQNDNPCF